MDRKTTWLRDSVPPPVLSEAEGSGDGSYCKSSNAALGFPNIKTAGYRMAPIERET
jgi:hypothetical protein